MHQPNPKIWVSGNETLLFLCVDAKGLMISSHQVEPGELIPEELYQAMRDKKTTRYMWQKGAPSCIQIRTDDER